MSSYMRVEKTNLEITKRQAKGIVLECRRANEEFDWEIEEECLKNLGTILEYLGLEFEKIEEDEIEETEEKYVLESYSNGFYYDYNFENILSIIAKYLDKNKRFFIIVKWEDYDERTKYVFQNGKLSEIEETRAWADGIDD